MSENPQPKNRAISWLRFIVWMMPSALVMTFVLTPALPARFRWLEHAFIPAAIAALLALAYFDACLECHQRGISPRDPTVSIAARMYVYGMLQIFVTPLISAVLAFGYCASNPAFP